jgi:hypothetical protein
MNVLAFSTPGNPEWRWRIVDYRGGTVEESPAGFATIAQAVAEGVARLRNRADRDDRPAIVPPRSFSWRRRR